jgi:ADP-ribose pyrophosphatase YjhB (NUDIX family)
MKPEELDRLVELLRRLRAGGLVPPHMPYLVWRAVADLVPQPAVEVVASRTGRDFLLVHRRDEHWDGWHLPGGFMAPGESIAGACNRVAEREVGVSVAFVRVVTAFAWPHHPYAHAVSLVCHCTTPQGEPRAGTFFTELPAGMVMHHADFVRAFLTAAAGTGPAPAPAG